MPKLFVGNLPFDTTEDQVQQLFSAHGTVASAVLIKDRETGRSRGFAFVEMPNDAESQAAIQALNGTTVGTRQIVVNPARPQENRERGHGGGGGGGYRDRGGSGGFGGGGDRSGGRGGRGGRDRDRGERGRWGR